MFLIIRGALYSEKFKDTEEGETIQLLKEKDKKTNNDLQNTTQNTKDWATRSLLKLEVKSCAPEG